MESDSVNQSYKDRLLEIAAAASPTVGPNYDQFKPKDPVSTAKDQIPSMAERAHNDLAPVWGFLKDVEDILARGDLILLEPATRDLFLLVHKLIEDKLELSDKLDQLAKTMIDHVVRAHVDAYRNNSLHNPNLRI